MIGKDNGLKVHDYQLGTVILRYLLDEESGHVSMILLPFGMDSCFDQRRSSLSLHENICPAWNVGNLCYLALRHHAQGNGAGSTLKYGASADMLHYQRQEVKRDKRRIRILTWLSAKEGYQVRHEVSYHEGEQGMEVSTTFLNRTGRTVTLDMLTSFVLDNLSPFQPDDAPYKMKLHRFRGGWSLEGKKQEETAEELNLESTWFRGFPESERYGCRGSFPVKRWFPFGCVEDMEYHTFWAAQIGCNSSWQMEFSRDGDCYSLSGGLADCEFGGWWKDVEDGGNFTAPTAYVSVSNISFEDACQNITEMFHRRADMQPETEKNMPLIFNEWCTSWGNPTAERMRSLKECLLCLPVRYLVIDAGWSKKNSSEKEPQGGNGDWELDTVRFPQGLRSLSDEMQINGKILGIWMEFEVTTTGSSVHSSTFDALHLYRNGEIIETGRGRRFWDFRKKAVRDYLEDKVIRFLRDNKIGYLKVDYNGNIGFGCDGAESPGEGLRQQMDGVYMFFCQIRRELPNLVIENCSSGGHRLEPKMMGITAMSVFSDAHECREIPFIAASLHYLILPRQCQVWAVLLPELSRKETVYRLTALMLGRGCLSGQIDRLNRDQMELLTMAMEFYQNVKMIIKYGRSSIYRDTSNNQHHLKGLQAVVRYGKDGRVLIICHSFASRQAILDFSLPEGTWRITGSFGDYSCLLMRENRITIRQQEEWNGFAICIENENQNGGQL